LRGGTKGTSYLDLGWSGDRQTRAEQALGKNLFKEHSFFHPKKSCKISEDFFVFFWRTLRKGSRRFFCTSQAKFLSVAL